MAVKELLVPGIVAITAVIIGWFIVDKVRSGDPFQDKNLLLKGMDRPVVWVFVNTSDVNSRSWADFMSRSSKVMNLPFLNVCYESLVLNLKDVFRFEVIGGLQDLAQRLGGWEALPSTLQNPQTVLREPELNWVRSAVLAKWGGLWVDPAMVWLKPLPLTVLPKDKVVFFGTNPDDTYATGKDVPSLKVIWSPKPAHPVWVDWEQKVRARLEWRTGGSEFRHDERKDVIDAVQNFPNDVQVFRIPEVSRKGGNRRRIELEDLLAAGTEGELPFDVCSNGVYVPIPYPEILERESFGWFLRMSEDQILESDLVISHLLKKGLRIV